jgi:hypothetical protein
MNSESAGRPDIGTVEVTREIMHGQCAVGNEKADEVQERLLVGSLEILESVRANRDGYSMVIMDRGPLDFLDVCRDYVTSDTHPMISRVMQGVANKYESAVREAMTGTLTIVPPVPPADHMSKLYWTMNSQNSRIAYLKRRYQVDTDKLDCFEVVDMWRQSHARSYGRICDQLRVWGHDCVPMPQVPGANRHTYFNWTEQASIVLNYQHLVSKGMQ